MLNIEELGDVTVLRLEHGRVNAMDVELLDALTAAVTATDRALLITGTGTAFSAGVDLRRILDGGPTYVADFLVALSRMFSAVFDHPRPTVAAVNGHAIAGGCVLALACDVRLMSGRPDRPGRTGGRRAVPRGGARDRPARARPRADRVLLARTPSTPSRRSRSGWSTSSPGPTTSSPGAWTRRGLGVPVARGLPMAKERLHRPAAEAIDAAAPDEHAAVLDGWTSAETRGRIEAALERLATRRAG